MTTKGQIKKRSEIWRDSPMMDVSWKDSNMSSRGLIRYEPKETEVSDHMADTKTTSAQYMSISRRHREWSTGPRSREPSNIMIVARTQSHTHHTLHLGWMTCLGPT